MLYSALSVVSFLLFFNIRGGSAEECGRQAGGALCPDGRCCSRFGWCGSTTEYCDTGCQSQCESTDISNLVLETIFDNMLKHRNDCGCPAQSFYTYDSFIAATEAFPAFAATGDIVIRKREIAAFFAQTSHETNGGWETAPDGPYAWGYCTLREQNPVTYCKSDEIYPCTAGEKYYGRGPFQLSGNDKYGECGDDLGLDLLGNPDLVATDSIVSFETALWYWMTPRSNKPSCHDVIIGNWKPSLGDQLAGRVPGYGMTTTIINGDSECGKGRRDERAQNRIGFYKRYCDLLGVDYGDNLDCDHQKPFFESGLATYNSSRRSSHTKTVGVE